MSTARVAGLVEVAAVGSADAATVYAVVQAAFGARAPLHPPADALSESEADLATRLDAHPGLLARVDGEPAGVVILDPVGQTMYLRRFGVVPSMQGHGVAGALVAAAMQATIDAPHTFDDLSIVAREELPQTVRFWQRQGFREIRRRSPSVELRRPLRTAVYDAPDAESMRGLGRSLARQLGPGDLIVLTGSLGAGKTTFTQGLGSGLGVRGSVTSPTFVIARVHPSEIGGPALVHVDAYRLGGATELDDLDLDASLEEAVTVVEWGEGVAEGMTDSRLEVRIVRADWPDGLDGLDERDPRTVEITAVGPRWGAGSLRGLG